MTYWCHGCGAEREVREEGGELLCRTCSGCFVEVVEETDNPQGFRETQPQAQPQPQQPLPHPHPHSDIYAIHRRMLGAHQQQMGNMGVNVGVGQPHFTSTTVPMQVGNTTVPMQMSTTTVPMQMGTTTMPVQVGATAVPLQVGTATGFANIARTMEQMLGGLPVFPARGAGAGAGADQNNARFQDFLHRILQEHDAPNNPAAAAALESLPLITADATFCEEYVHLLTTANTSTGHRLFCTNILKNMHRECLLWSI